MLLNLILLLVIVLPIAWLASEFQTSRATRIILGIAAILMSFGVASIVGSLERFRSNTYFGSATKDLVQNTIKELEAGNTERVLSELRRLRSEYNPTYETRGRYADLVSEYVQRVSENPIVHQRGLPGWAEHEDVNQQE